MNQPPAMMQQPMMTQQPAKRRSVVAIIFGVLFLLGGLAAGGLYYHNWDQIRRADDTFADLDPHAQRFAKGIMKKANERRMAMFGPVAGVGLVLGLGLIVFGAGKKKA